MFWLELLLLGIIGILGVLLQAGKLIEGKVITAVVPLVIGFILFIGALIHGVFNIFIGGGSYGFTDFVSVIWSLIVATLVLTLKNLFAPIIFTVLLLIAIYGIFEFGQFDLWSFEEFKSFIRWGLSGFPEWLQILYSIVTCLVVFAGVLDVAIL